MDNEWMAVRRRLQSRERPAVHADPGRRSGWDEDRRNVRATECSGGSRLPDAHQSQQSQPLHLTTQCLKFPAQVNLWGNLGRNVPIGPGLENLDLSVFKNNRVRRLSEAFNVQFGSEFFDVLNHANFASPVDNSWSIDQNGKLTSSAGLITSTQTPQREIQFALKLIWYTVNIVRRAAMYRRACAVAIDRPASVHS